MSAGPIWRLGSNLPKVLFRGGVYAATVANPELAAEMADRLNAGEPAEVSRLRGEVAQLQKLLADRDALESGAFR